MKKKFLFIVLFFLFSIICYAGEIPVFYDQFDTAHAISIEENKPLLLIFTANWCNYCTKLKEDVISKDNITDYIVCIVDIDNNKNLAKKFRVKSLPTTLVLRTDNEKKRKIGYKNRKDYIDWLYSN